MWMLVSLKLKKDQNIYFNLKRLSKLGNGSILLRWPYFYFNSEGTLQTSRWLGGWLKLFKWLLSEGKQNCTFSELPSQPSTFVIVLATGQTINIKRSKWV